MYSSDIYNQIINCWNRVGKPLGSLGKLEPIVAQIGAIQGRTNAQINRRLLIVLCADNGIIQEGVSQTGSEVTSKVADSIAKGSGNISAFCKVAKCDTQVVDIGMEYDAMQPNVINKKIARGTGNILTSPAMSFEQMEEAIHVGISLMQKAKKKGYSVVCTGEMGIGTTTTSSAMASVLLRLPPEKVTGRGAGLPDYMYHHKIDVIRRAIGFHQPDFSDPKEVLSKFGGFDIAGMVGLYLGAEKHGLPIIIDGIISLVAAFTATLISPTSRQYMIASHMGKEPACQYLLDAMNLSPCICADLSLGEGTGAVALLPLIDMALSVYHRGATFNQLNIPAYEEFDKKS
jgi:nicotinate-nucleotide--dimethylbenzimidazole phosphoribosyltransferase